MMRYISMAAIALAGLIHLGLAPEHYAHAPAHGIFFVGAGIVEISWALAFWRCPTQALYRTGLALVGGMIVLWAITRVLPAPFGHGLEAINVSGLACKGSELIGIIALVMLALQGQLIGVTRPSVLRAGGEALALALIVGFAFFGIGHAMAPPLPALGPQEEDVHEEHAHGHEAETHVLKFPEVNAGEFVLLYFESKNCLWCTKVEQDVKASLRKNFVLIAIEASNYSDLVSKYNVPTTPTMILLDRDGKEIARIVSVARAYTNFLQ